MSILFTFILYLKMSILFTFILHSLLLDVGETMWSRSPYLPYLNVLVWEYCSLFTQFCLRGCFQEHNPSYKGLSRRLGVPDG